MILLFAGIIGMGISFSWRIVIRSYQQLNTGKFKALEKLEEKLEYQFFKHEWELLSQGKYQKLTDAEKRLPVIFFVLFLLFLPISLYMICNQ